MTLRGFFAFVLACPAYAAFPVWITSSLQRTSPTAPPGVTKQAELLAAQRECAAFQIVMRAPAGGLSGVRVTASNLTAGDWALQQVKRIAPDWKNWTRDPSALESVRRELADKIQSIDSAQPTHR